MRKAIAVVLVAAALVLVTPPDTASASTGCVTRQEFNEVYNYWTWQTRSRVRAIFGTPGQRIAYDPSGPWNFGGGRPGLGSELRAYRTCPPGGAVWVYFSKGGLGDWLLGYLPGNRVPAMWWFT